jgi:5-methyltetrahydropteroyltriglutamate--homocysteine methyltransferase
MDPADRHANEPDASFDGGDLDCGGGLLLLIRRQIDPLEPGRVLEILSTDSTVEVELPAWCRLTGNELVSWIRNGNRRSYLVCKGSFSGSGRNQGPTVPIAQQHRVEEGKI